MRSKPPAFNLEAGRLRPIPDVTTGARARTSSTHSSKRPRNSTSSSGRPATSHARSGLVIHPDDRTLRIDLQHPPPGWANLQLQAGADSLACVLLEADQPYRAADVREAFLESLAQKRNARMIWRYPIELHVLNSLNLWEPRGLKQIIDQMAQRGSGPGMAYQMPYLTTQINSALAVLEKNSLVSRRSQSTWRLCRRSRIRIKWSDLSPHVEACQE